MITVIKFRWTAVLLGFACFALAGAPAAFGDEKKSDKESLLSKTEELTDADGKDTKLKNSHAKIYKVKLMEGKAYRIDLSSTDFDTFLRLENAAGKEVAFNDDIDQKDLNSRLVFVAPKTGEYRIIATTYVASKTGTFTLEMKLATPVEAKEALFKNRIERFADSSRDDQKKLVLEITKRLQDKGEKLEIKDAQICAQLFFTADDSDAAFLREMGQSFAKIFEGAEDKRLVGFSKQLTASLKALDKIGTEIEISGKTLAGKDFDLKNMKGKVVLVDFWGTWCPPCVAEIPNIVTAYEKFHGKGFEVIGIAQPAKDQTDDALSDWIEKKKMPWGCINIEDSQALIKKHGVNSFPNPILVGADGRIISMRARGPQLERLLERLLKEGK